MVVSSCTLNRRETTMKQILGQEHPAESLTMSNRNEDWGIHTYLPKSEVDQDNEKDEEYARLQTFDNWDYELALKLRKLAKDKVIYTTDLLVVEQLLIDYGTDLKVLFSESNPHYVCVWEIYNTILYYRGNTRLRKIFTPENIVILQWLIADDWRQYRQRVLTKADLTSPGRINWPRSYLKPAVDRLHQELVLAPASFPPELRRLGIGTGATGREGGK